MSAPSPCSFRQVREAPSRLVRLGGAVGREGFAYSISQHRCSWPKPIAIKGAKTMEYVSTGSTEVMGPSITTTSQGITTYDNGDKGFTRATGKVDGKAGTNSGKWTFIGGTGHLSGIKGGGTFVCKLKGPEPGAGFACDIKGSYTLPPAK